MAAPFTKQEADAMMARRKEAADFEATAPERAIWERAVLAGMHADWEVSAAITDADTVLTAWKDRFRQGAEVKE